VLASAVALGIGMMALLPPDKIVPVARGLGGMVQAFASAFSSGIYQILGWVVAGVITIAATAVIIVQRQRRLAQDAQLRQLREQEDPSRASSQMSMPELLKRQK